MGTAILRRDLARIGAALYQHRYVVAGEGNLSVRLRRDRFLVTPSGVCKGWLEPGDLLEVDRDGRAFCTDRSASSEWLLHRAIYEHDPAVGAVCHAHPPYATACAAARRSLDSRVLTETAALLGDVPLARPAVAGTDDLADSVREQLPGPRALLLANHGVVAWGRDITEAFFRLESVERLAEITLLAGLAGGAKPLSDELMRRLGGGQGPDGSPR